MGMCVSRCGTEPYGRLPTYLYPKGSGPNVIQKIEISCVKFRKSVVNFLFRSSKYVVVNLLCTLTCDFSYVPWFFISVMYLDFSRMKRWIFLNHFENFFFLNRSNLLWKWEFWENIVFLGRHVWLTQGCKTKPLSSNLKELKSLNSYKHFCLLL